MLALVAPEPALPINQKGHRKSFRVPLMIHVVEITARIWGRQRTVFSPALAVAATLHHMQSPGIPGIGTHKRPAPAVKIQRPAVAAPFGEQLKPVSLWVVAPDHLPKPGTSGHLGGAGTALYSVNPPIRAKRQGVGHRVSVLQAKSLQAHLRFPFRQPVPVLIRIK